MSLREYRRKRTFARTPEPAGAAPRPRSDRPQFVIQKHAASRLHYDFRLEMGGVLKSWAIPKGPSLDPRERHLAVHVEDHPVEYGSFEGIIPAGQYGGGTVLLWDRGHWEPLGSAERDYRAGRLKFRLFGNKLRGGWMLVRLAQAGAGKRGNPAERGKENWLLIKERDDEARPSGDYDIRTARPESVATGRSLDDIAAQGDAVWQSHRAGHGRKPRAIAGARAGSSPANAQFAKNRTSRTGTRQRGKHPPPTDFEPGDLPGARRARMPVSIQPQLATLVDAAPAGDDWLHEMKYDGYRMLAFVNGGTARLVSRNGNDWTAAFPVVATATGSLGVDAVLDGEVVVLRSDGTTDFQSLQNVLKGAAAAHLVYFVFDLLYCAGQDLRGAPLLARKELLRRLLERAAPESGTLRYSDHIRGNGGAVLRQACQFGMEGIVSKRVDRPHESRRSRGWVKVKCTRRQEFVIGGWTDPAGTRTGFGALLVGVYEDDALVFCGRVGTGFDTQSLRSVLAELKPREQKQPPFHNPPRGADARSVHWVRPELVAEVAFTEWTTDGILRHPSFQGLRADKDAREVIREGAATIRAEPTSAAPAARGPRKTASRPGGRRAGGPGSSAAPLRQLDAAAHPRPWKSPACA